MEGEGEEGRGGPVEKCWDIYNIIPKIIHTYIQGSDSIIA